MARGHYRIAKAAKDRACTERSWHTIRKGELYLSAACPPEHEANMGRKWWRISACLKCAESFGLHTSETRKQLEARTPVNTKQPAGVVVTESPDVWRLCFDAVGQFYAKSVHKSLAESRNRNQKAAIEAAAFANAATKIQRLLLNVRDELAADARRKAGG